MFGNAVDLVQSLDTDLVEERRQSVFVEPGGGFREGCDIGQRVRRDRGTQVAEQIGTAQARGSVVGQLHREQALVYDAAETIHDAGAVDIETCRRIVCQRMEAGAPAEGVRCAIQTVPAQRFEQRMPRGDPLQILFLSRVAVGRQARIASRQLRVLPARLALVPLQARRCATRIERMHHAPDRLQIQGRVLGTLRDEACACLRHDAAFLGTCPALDQHVQVELLGCQSFQSIVADRAEVALVDILQESFFQVLVTQLAGIEVAQHAFHVSGWQHLPDHVEHRVIVERVADLLQLVQQPLQHPSLDRVGRHEVEDQTVQPLPVAMDAAHSLFQAIRIPRDVVVEQDVAALQVDALTGRFGSHQHLDRAVAELLLGVEPGSSREPGFIPP